MPIILKENSFGFSCYYKIYRLVLELFVRTLASGFDLSSNCDGLLLVEHMMSFLRHCYKVS